MKKLRCLPKLFLALCVVAIFAQTRVYADPLTTICTSDSHTVTGTIARPSHGSYDVYVKLGTPGQRAEVTGYYMYDSDPSCKGLGTVTASADSWTQLGSYDNTSSETVLFQLASSALTDLSAVNRPQLLLLPHTSAPCVPDKTCQTTIDGMSASLVPDGISTETNSLNVLVASDLGSSNVTKVEYYADNELLYTTQKVEPFNTESLPFSSHKLYTVVYYDTHQKAVIETAAPEGHMDNPVALFMRTLGKYRVALVLLSVTSGIVLIILLVRNIFYWVGRHRAWKIAHGLAATKDTPQTMTPALERQIESTSRVKKTIKIIQIISVIFGSAVLIVVVLTMYVIQINTVNGHSMDTAFRDRQSVFVYKFGVTLAQVNNRSLQPTRGQVVIVRPNFGTDTMTDSSEDGTIIKRVIGLPGDRIVLKNGSFTIYNTQHPEGFDPSKNTSWARHIQPDTTGISLDITLGVNETFICGDNRPISIDSRYNGPVNTRQIIGIVL